MEGKQYFRRLHPLIMVALLFFIILEVMCVFAPGNVPYNLFGPFGPNLSFVVYKYPRYLQRIFLVSLVLNVSVGILAYCLARSKGIDNPARFTWSLHCLIFGIFSLWKLIFFNGNSSTTSEQHV